MDKNGSPPTIDQLADFVEHVETLLANARLALETLAPSDGNQTDKEINVEAFESVLKKSSAHEQRISDLHKVFVGWEQAEISPYEKSEVVRAISLLKRANIVTENTLRLVKKGLGIPDPDREQAELQMQLQAMGVIHGGHH